MFFLQKSFCNNLLTTLTNYKNNDKVKTNKYSLHNSLLKLTNYEYHNLISQF